MTDCAVTGGAVDGAAGAAGDGREAADGLLDRLHLREFRREDVEVLEGRRPENASVGLTGLIDGRVVGYGGVHRIAGRHWGFFRIDGSEAGRRLTAEHPRFLHRMAVRMLAIFDASGIEEICALCDVGYPRADAWLAALGFRPLGDEEKPDDMVALEAACGGLSSWIRRRGAGIGKAGTRRAGMGKAGMGKAGV